MNNQVKGYIICESALEPIKPTILTSDKVDRVKINTTLQSGDVKNRNKRIYPTQVIKNGLNSAYVQERLRTNSWYGEGGHPLSPDIKRQLYLDQSNISHLINKVWWEGNLLKAEVSAANTARGKDFDGLIRQGSEVAFSLRAVGFINKAYYKYN